MTLNVLATWSADPSLSAKQTIQTTTDLLDPPVMSRHCYAVVVTKCLMVIE
jgi:hypothetical protein